MPTTPTVLDLAKMALMSPSQRHAINRQIDNNRRALHGSSMNYEGVTDQDMLARLRDSQEVHHVRHPEPDILRRSIDLDTKMRDAGTAPDYPGYTKNAIYKMYKEDLIPKWRDGLLTAEQMNQPTELHIRQFLRHQNQRKRFGLAARTAHRIFAPDDEDFSLELLRPETPRRVDPTAFFANYDEMTWANEQEHALANRDLDPETYMAFLTLKAQGVNTPRLIQRTLGISQALYEVCLQRLKDEAAQVALEDGEEEPLVEYDAPQPAVAHTAVAVAEDCVLTGSQLVIVEKHGKTVLELLASSDDATLTRAAVGDKTGLKGIPLNALLSGLVKMGQLKKEAAGHFTWADEPSQE